MTPLGRVALLTVPLLFKAADSIRPRFVIGTIRPTQVLRLHRLLPVEQADDVLRFREE
jgi:hypothetical protein